MDFVRQWVNILHCSEYVNILQCSEYVGKYYKYNAQQIEICLLETAFKHVFVKCILEQSSHFSPEDKSSFFSRRFCEHFSDFFICI